LLQVAATLVVARAELGVEGVACCGHDPCLVPQSLNEGGDDASTSRRVGLDLAPVRLDLLRRRSVREVDDLLDPCQRHAQQPERRDQAGPLELRGSVPAIPRVLVNLRRKKQAQVVVQPQRLRRQPRIAGEVSDRHEHLGLGHGHHPPGVGHR
jgi:hypothetical protein